jgi:hypothetical protein
MRPLIAVIAQIFIMAFWQSIKIITFAIPAMGD